MRVKLTLDNFCTNDEEDMPCPCRIRKVEGSLKLTNEVGEILQSLDLRFEREWHKDHWPIGSILLAPFNLFLSQFLFDKGTL